MELRNSALSVVSVVMTLLLSAGCHVHLHYHAPDRQVREAQASEDDPVGEAYERILEKARGE